MATTRKGVLGAQATLLNTGAALANNALALSAAFNNVQAGGAGDGYLEGRLTFNGTFGVAPAANTGLAVWFLTSEDDGATYEDGDASTTPARLPDVVIPARPVATAQQVARDCLLPTGHFKALVKNDGTGQQLNSGWTLKVRPRTDQMV